MTSKNGWAVVPLGEVLFHRKEFIRIDDLAKYNRCRVQLHAKGVVLRDKVEGAVIKTKTQQVCRTEELLVAEIDAKVGGYGLVPLELDGAIVSSHYFLFPANRDRLEPRFLDYFVRTSTFRDQVSARGSTNYAAIRPHHVLAYKIPLPSLPEQRRIVAKIERLAAKFDEARGLREVAVPSVDAIIRAEITRIDRTLRAMGCLKTLEQVASPEKGSLRSGPFGSSLLHHEFVDTGIPAIGIEDVQKNRFRLSRRWHVTPEKANELRRFEIRPGDILITVMGTLGRTCAVPMDIPRMISTKHVWTVTLNTALADSWWVSYWLWIKVAN